mgnify:CR=1 FL=1
MFYNHLIFSKVTLSLRICLKYLVLPSETRSFNKENCQYPLVQLLVPYGMLLVFMRYMPYIPILFATCSALR